jgi:hypothetical protein
MNGIDYKERMLAIMHDRQKQDEKLMLSLKPVKEKSKKKKKKGKGFKTLMAIRLFPGDTFLRDINLVPVRVKDE